MFVTEPASELSRRRHRRIEAVGRVFAQLGGGWEASVLNLSVAGMHLRLKRALTPGASYVVKLFLEKQIAIVEARVVRLSQAVSEGQDEAERFAALQLISVPTRDAARLRGYIYGNDRFRPRSSSMRCS